MGTGIATHAKTNISTSRSQSVTEKEDQNEQTEIETTVVIKNCLVCGQSYIDHSSNQTKTTCSPKCRHKYYNAKRVKAEPITMKKDCPICGRSYTYNSHRNNLTCSHKCSEKYYGRTNTVEKECPICGQLYVDRSSHHIKLTCGSKCARKYFLVRNPESLAKIKFQSRIDNIKRHGTIFTPCELSTMKEKLKSGICEICNNTFPMSRLCIDHDHFTNKYRGILCDNCNRVLGMVHDNPIILEEMITYLGRDK
jgi:ribosomal protein L24E